MIQALELRQVPVITEVDVVVKGVQKEHAVRMVEDLRVDPAKNWLNGASIQHAFGGSSLSRTLDNWKFYLFGCQYLRRPAVTRQINGRILFQRVPTCLWKFQLSEPD